jgi:hypothetical protein
MMFAITALLFATGAQGQSGPAPPAAAASGCPAQPNQSSCLSIASLPALEFPADLRIGDAPGTFTLFGNVKGVALVQSDISRTTSSVGPTWRVKTGILYQAPGGVQFTASAIARRGNHLPITMVQPLGSDVQSADYSSAFLQSGATRIQWDTELRIRKALFSSDVLDLAVVGEAFNLLNLNPAPDPAAKTPAVTSSPTVRGGVLLGF